MRKYLLLFLFGMIGLGMGSKGLAASSGYATYLPMVSLGRSSWLGPDGGRPVALAIDPSNPAILYAGSWGTGMHKSVDGGLNWFQINTGLDNWFINSLAIDPTQPEILYAGTYHSQVYKTTDGGQNWTWSGTGIQEQAVVYTIAIDPVSPNNLYVGTRGISNNGLPPWNGVVYKSTDSGATWRPVLQNVGGVNAQDWAYSIAVNPQDSNLIYAALHEHGAYRSTNAGEYWISISEGITDLSGRGIAVDWQSPEPYTLYLGVWHGDGVFRSDDGGELWNQTNAGIQGIAIYGMTMDPLDAQRIFLSTFSIGVMQTQDGGGTWLPSGLSEDGIYTVAINPQDSAILYAGTAGDGLYASQDGGQIWQHSQAGIHNTDIISVIPLRTNPQHLFAALYGGGVLQSLDGGGAWVEMNTGLSDKFVLALVADPSNPAILFALTQTGGLFRNDTTNADGWTFVGHDLPLTMDPRRGYRADDPRASRETLLGEPFFQSSSAGIPEAENLLSMIFSPSTPTTAYVATGGAGVFKSLNGGLDWFASGLENQYVRSLAVDPANVNYVYAVTDEAGHVRFSEDGGGSWRNLELYVPVVYTVAVAQDGSGRLYAGTNTGVFVYTPDIGWTNTGLDGTPVILLVTNPQHPGVLFAGAGNGAFYTTDGGVTWQSAPAALAGQTVQSISFDPVDAHIVYFGTKTHGIFRAYIWF
jgi:photosystem II stability/assembly factor-like uncharacterized protein